MLFAGHRALTLHRRCDDSGGENATRCRLILRSTSKNGWRSDLGRLNKILNNNTTGHTLRLLVSGRSRMINRRSHGSPCSLRADTAPSGANLS